MPLIPVEWIPGLEIIGAVVVLIVGLLWCHRDQAGIPHQHDVSWSRISMGKPSWSQESQWPMLVAATIFVLQLLGSVILLNLMHSVQRLADNWTPRFRRSLRTHCVIAALGSMSYIRDFCSEEHIIAERPGIGQHLMMRNLNWLIGTPLQWFIFGEVCTQLTVVQMKPVFVACFGLQLFGILMHVAPSTSIFYVSFAMSCGCFWWMFLLVFELPLVKEMEVSAHRTRQVCFVVWTLYPLLNLIRWLGLIDDWCEQVLCLSLLDAFAKMFTFSSIVLARVTLTLSSYNGALQIVLASHDLVLVVNEKFQLLDCPQPLPLITHYFGKVVARTSLEQLCKRRTDFNRLRDVASLADSASLGVPSPQCNVTFTSSNGKEFHAACFISKCINGRRVISMNIHASEDSQDNNCADFGSHVAPKAVMPSSLRMQLEIALHHCSEFMSLNQQQHDLLKSLFIETDASCVLCVLDSSEGDDCVDIVTASQRARMIHLATKDLPQPLTGVLRSADLHSMMRAMTHAKPVAIQQAGTQLETGCEATVTVFPLQYSNQSSTLFFVMVFEIAESVSQCNGEGSDQMVSFWYNVGDEAQLVRMNSEVGDLIGPPTYVRVPREHEEQVWSAFFKLPVEGTSGSPALSQDLLAFAMPIRLPGLQVRNHRTIRRFDELWPDMSAEEAAHLLERRSFKSQLDYMVPVPDVLQPLVTAFASRSPSL